MEKRHSTLQTHQLRPSLLVCIFFWMCCQFTLPLFYSSSFVHQQRKYSPIFAHFIHCHDCSVENYNSDSQSKLYIKRKHEKVVLFICLEIWTCWFQAWKSWRSGKILLRRIFFYSLFSEPSDIQKWWFGIRISIFLSGFLLEMPNLRKRG
jgi:hypothetical protein